MIMGGGAEMPATELQSMDMHLTIVEKPPTVGRSVCLLIDLLFVLKTNVAFVRFCLSNPPKMRMDDGSI